MPIVNVKHEHAPTLEVRCAECGGKTDHALSTLVLGALSAGSDVQIVNVNNVVLPPCSCGAQEILIRTFDGEDDSSAGHRKAVNAVAGYLKGAGRVHPDAAAALASETVRPRLTRPLLGPV